MNISIKKAILILTDETDKITLETSLPCPYSPNFLPSQPNLTLKFETTHDMGTKYIKENFGEDFKISIINLRSKNNKS